MNCERAMDLLGAYRDGELAAHERREVAAHIETCKACSDIAAHDERIGQALQAQGRVPVPIGLASRLRQGLAQVDNARRSEEGLGGRPFLPFDAFRHRLVGWSRQAGVVAVACIFSAWATWWIVSGLGQTDRVEREIMSAHIRSLLQETTVQVASSDQHTVRPWFAGRLDFSPTVKDFKAEGFALIGGRLDYVNDRRVGVVVYKQNLHIVNVFVWPATDPADKPPHLSTRNGYNLLSWSSAGVSYRAVSDLNAVELGKLQRLL